jgi:hypothetical protein
MRLSCVHYPAYGDLRLGFFFFSLDLTGWFWDPLACQNEDP